MTVTLNDPSVEPLEEPDNKHFRKSRVLMMEQALTELRPVIKGNQRIDFSNGLFTFYYRDTALMEYELATKALRKLNAGKFEGLPSTRSQRRAIYEAIQDFEKMLDETE